VSHEVIHVLIINETQQTKFEKIDCLDMIHLF